MSRQIKNAVRTAQAVSTFKNESLDHSLMEEVLTLMGSFTGSRERSA
jgi:hypothetical protein